MTGSDVTRTALIPGALILGAALLAMSGSPAEAARGGKKAQADPQALFERLDKNGDGRVDEADAPEGERGERFLKRLERMDGDGDGELSMEELESARAKMKGRARQARRGGRDAGARMAQRDADGDGQISFEEFLGDGQRFEKADADGDGVVLREEVAEKGQGERALRRFDKADLNHDGRLTRDEVEDAARQRFEKLDANGDGSLSRDELGRKKQQGRRGRTGGQET